MSNLISLTCPNCGSPLESDSTEMKIKCTYCGAEILVKDFITERRVDKSDKLSSLQALANNAATNQQYEKAYGYYEEICKLEPTKENLALMDYYGYASGHIEYIEPIISKLYVFEPKQHRILVDRLRIILRKKKDDEVINGSLTIEQAGQKYDPLISELDREYEKLKAKRCKCGAVLEYNEDICPKCGTSFSEYQRKTEQEAAAKRKSKKSKIIKLCIIIGVPVIAIIIITSVFLHNVKVSAIKQAIQEKDYPAAETLLENYKKSYSDRAELYDLYADLYLAEGNPQKAVEVLEDGLKNASSGKDDLRKKLNSIKNEYQLK